MFRASVKCDGALKTNLLAMRQLRTAVLYFVLVFSAGFVLGTVRVLFVVPAIGVRAAELIEMPLMLAIVVVAARFITRRTAWLVFGGLVALGASTGRYRRSNQSVG
jgi:hypothetical protein